MEPEERVNILLVDDNPTKLLALEAAIVCLGQNVVKAHSGEEALRYLLHQDFAVILLDVNMPDINGFELAELIRRRPRSRHTPVIFISAVSQTEEYAFKGYALGAVDYLHTPIPEVVRAKVAVFVELFKKTEEVKRQQEALRRLNAELEKRVAERTAELQRSNEELQQFAYVASHDLQEPLRMVASYVRLLAKRYQGKLDAEADEFIRYAVEGATRMKELIDDLLAYSRAGTQEQDIATIDCGVVLQRVLNDLRAAIEESGAEVTHDPLPCIMADEVRLRQVFQNLLGNALKFRSQAPPRIHIGVERDATHWIFAVRDNGIGIDPQHAERIFVLFQRLHTKDKYPGTGMGLAICKRIVERHHGRIWLESQPGVGTTFFFSLPVEKGL